MNLFVIIEVINCYCKEPYLNWYEKIPYSISDMILFGIS